MPLRTIALIAAFSPGQSPPPVSTPMRTAAPYRRDSGSRAQAIHQRLSSPHEHADEEDSQKDEEGQRAPEPEPVGGHQACKRDGREDEQLHGGQSTRRASPHSPWRLGPRG